MPIKKENAVRYPRDWKQIRQEVLERAGHKCEGSPMFPDCRVANYAKHPVTGSKVVLTVAHLNHVPEDVGVPGNRPNLKAWCNRCHLAYDHEHHMRNASQTRHKRKAVRDLFA